MDWEYRGAFSRMSSLDGMGLSVLPGQTLSIVVEGMGRVSSGDELRDYKVSFLTLNYAHCCLMYAYFRASTAP